MARLKSFKEFISESALSIPSGKESDAIQKLTSILSANVNKKETPDNSGPMVKDFLGRVGLNEGEPWCMAFVYAAFDDLTKSLGIKNPLPKTAGVLSHWQSADSSLKLTIDSARANPSLILPGMIFFKTRPGSGKGHTGIVLKSDPNNGSFMTIDGNSNDMVKLNTYSIKAQDLIGFVDYFKDIRRARESQPNTGLSSNSSLETALQAMANTIQQQSGSSITTPGGKED